MTQISSYDKLYNIKIMLGWWATLTAMNPFADNAYNI
jgi:hypothetical protein